jgi:hypothetical protein
MILACDGTEPDLLSHRRRDNKQHGDCKHPGRPQPVASAGEKQDHRANLNDQRNPDADQRDMLKIRDTRGNDHGPAGEHVDIAGMWRHECLPPRQLQCIEQEKAVLCPKASVQQGGNLPEDQQCRDNDDQNTVAQSRNG